MIKYILIDIDGTLLDFEGAVEESIKTCSAIHGITMPHDILDIFHPINNDLWNKIEKGELDITGLRRIRWNTVFEKTGINYDGEKFEKDFYSELTSSAIPMEGALELLEYLSEKYVIFAATNAETDQQICRLRKCGMLPYLQGIFTSEMLGEAKPSPLFFEKCLLELGSPEKESVIMIGDSEIADIFGAHSVNIKTCQFSKSGAFSPLADFKVTELESIKKIL